MDLPLMPDLLDLLVCPACKGRIDYTEDAEGLACEACCVVYPIEDDIPNLIVEEAVSFEDWDKRQSSGS